MTYQIIDTKTQEMLATTMRGSFMLSLAGKYKAEGRTVVVLVITGTRKSCITLAA